MTEEQVVDFVRSTLNLPALEADAQMGMVRGWDSLRQVSLMLALEEFADVSVPPDLFAELTSVGAIIQFLDEERVL